MKLSISGFSNHIWFSYSITSKLSVSFFIPAELYVDSEVSQHMIEVGTAHDLEINQARSSML